MKKILILGLFSMLGSWLLAQAPEKFNYQAVARDSLGNPMASQSLDLRFSIHEGGTGGTVVYQEEFQSVPTNNYGLFNLQIGNGTPVQGLFPSIDWSSNTFFLEVEMRSGSSSYSSLGASQIVSVAYALFAKDVQNKDDADADPANELQTLSLTGDTLSISNGNSVTLIDRVYDGDSSTTNEIQVLSISDDTLRLSSGNYVLLPQDQDWTKSGNRVYNTSDSIGIGTSQPEASLDIVGSLKFDDGNQVEGRVLKTDSLGFARWDTIVNPYTFYATNPNWVMTGGPLVENIYCTATITLTKRSMVVVNAHGHIHANQIANAVAGIVFSGETLFSASPNVYGDLKQSQLGTVGPGIGWTPVATSRAKVLAPGTYQISLRFYAPTGGNPQVYLAGASLNGYIIPFN